MRGWRELRAFARLEIGLTSQEFESSTPAELDELIAAWNRKEQRQDERLASIMSHLSNVIVASAGGKARFSPSDFLAVKKKATPKMSAKELRAMAMLAFGPPPAK